MKGFKELAKFFIAIGLIIFVYMTNRLTGYVERRSGATDFVADQPIIHTDIINLLMQLEQHRAIGNETYEYPMMGTTVETVSYFIEPYECQGGYTDIFGVTWDWRGAGFYQRGEEEFERCRYYARDCPVCDNHNSFIENLPPDRDQMAEGQYEIFLDIKKRKFGLVMDECYEWAFGYVNPITSDIDDLWNERHGDLFLISGTDVLEDALDKVRQECMRLENE